MPAKKAKKPAAKKGAKKAAPKAKGGDAEVKAWVAKVKPQHRNLVQRIDALIEEVIPDVRRAIKWSTPFYGRAGQGWLVTVGSFKEYVAVGFFAGTSLKPEPPEGESGQMRRVKLRDGEKVDEKRLRSWIEQAAKLPGWGKVKE